MRVTVVSRRLPPEALFKNTCATGFASFFVRQARRVREAKRNAPICLFLKLERLDGHDDVQSVADNFDIPD